MNAKELRKAAERLVAYSTPSMVNPYPPEINKTVKAADEDVLLIAGHILSTVREDDDEFADVPYARSVSWVEDEPGSLYLKNRDAYFLIFHIPKMTWMIGNSATGWTKLDHIKTRVQFRALCCGLGIELKEGE